VWGAGAERDGELTKAKGCKVPTPYKAREQTSNLGDFTGFHTETFERLFGVAWWLEDKFLRLKVRQQ
jgi:hypothetical protein